MSQHAELGLVGSALLDQEVFDRVSHLVSAIDFEDRVCRMLWKAIEEMAQQGIAVDVMTLAEHLERAGKLEIIGGWGELARIAQNTPSASRADHYAKQVHDAAALRHLAALCMDIAQKCRERQDDADGLALEAETRIHKLTTAKRAAGDFVSINDAMVKAIEYIDSRQSGEVSTIKTGLRHLDHLTGGFLRGSFNVVAARPSQGKTALGLTVSLGAVANDHKAAFCSLEMPAWQIGLRVMGMESGVSVQEMIAGELTDAQWTRITAQLGKLSSRGMYVTDANGLSVASIRAMVSRLKRTDGIDLLVVDYLQLMTPPKLDSREQQVAAMSSGLKALAKEFDLVVICLAQLNRDAAGRRPRMSDIRESGAVEQDADVVILIHREDNDGVPAREAELIVDKNRNGETGIVRVEWAAEQTRFYDFSPGASLRVVK
jgi:replicative DNA helicase